MGFFDSRFFEPTWKNKVLILQVAFTILIFIFGIVKIVTTPSHIPFNRMDIVAITMSLKSGLFLTYEIMTMKMNRFKRFGSLKAYAVLNTLDVFFWAAVMGFSFKSVNTICSGVNCAIGIVTGLLALVNSAIHFWAAVIAWKNHKYFKAYGVPRGQDEAKNRYTTTRV
ncbi:hypothetical protein FVEN_g989 [Fusarium venenatum]|uniref:MARVEL domain-containing protein n=1 Tax=Fusarium venenatum TaxID=56646 RepID=A0A2L2THR2_9HYPO|nr:uncharacterized protein FVRRES_10589 [Fusarium venenatum]KAG8361290.1 hypothetical protein FVEN_g989 [Fusarium venenatum]KAH6967187.1 hypothetical protein EDB82DRAFT_530870 [Fusarium venenatum]CEI70512.1 unnamed protein product [Fusarium venenatum]